MPSVPSKETEEDLGLPDVPTKPPVVAAVKNDANIASAEASRKSKALSLSLSDVDFKMLKELNNLMIFVIQLWRNHCLLDCGLHLNQC